jgi:hypothetical protein
MPALDFLDDSAFASLIIAVIGTVAIALAAFERLVSARDEAGRSKLRRFAIYVIVILTLIINITLHWFQYYNVTTVAAKERKKLEGELALSLWAYTNKEVVALKYLASNHKYMLGYHYFGGRGRAPARAASAQRGNQEGKFRRALALYSGGHGSLAE